MDFLTRFTLNVNTQAVGPDEEELLRVLRAWQPPGIFFMNALNCRDENSITQRAFRILQEWGGFVAYRHYQGGIEASLWSSYKDPARYVKEVMAHYGCKDVWWAVGNEPKPGKEADARAFAEWYSDLIDICLNEGWRLAVPGGMASASIEKWMWDAGWYDDLLLKVARNSHVKINGIPQILWADHMYAHAWLPAFADGRDVGILTSPARAKEQRDPGEHPMSLGWPDFKAMFLDSDISDNYLIARGHWPIARMRHLRRPELPEGVIDDLGIIVTECVFDRMPNVVQHSADIAREVDRIAGREVRGMPTLPRYWEFMRPGQPWEDTACQQLYWIDRDFPPEYLFFALFTWSWMEGNPTPWRKDYNIGDMPTFYKRVPSYWRERPIKRARYDMPDEPEEPTEEPVMVDVLPYLRGDGRLYELRNTWGGGGERLQTQFESATSRRFFESKNTLWSELWFDEDFVWRGTDTSPGNGEIYQLYEGATYGSRWIPRRILVGESFKRTALVSFRRKSDGAKIPGKEYTHTTWIKVARLHSAYTFQSGMQLEDVLELQGFEDQNGVPKAQPFETYFYAKDYGLVGWQGGPGKSFIAGLLPSGTPPNIREALPWLALPPLPPLETDPPPDDEPETPPAEGRQIFTLEDLQEFRALFLTGAEIIERGIARLQAQEDFDGGSD